MKILKSKRIYHLPPLILAVIIARSVSAADGITNTSVLSEFTNPLGTTITSDGAGGDSGYANVGGGSIGTFTNNGLITAPNGNGFFNNRPITTWINNGTVSGTGSEGTGFFQYISTIGTLTNAGTISGTGRAFYIYANGNINSFTNTSTGVISGTGATSPTIFLGARISTFLNEGLISGVSAPVIDLRVGGSFGSFTNTGDILGATALNITGVIDTLNNSGTISTSGDRNGISNSGTITTLNNSGTISAPSWDAISNHGTIRNLINSHVIRGFYYGIANNSGEIEEITNTGSIIGGPNNGGIYNWSAASITTLNNLQGQGNSNGALTYEGKLPTNYNIIINSASQYGQLAASFPSGAITNFRIYGAPFITSRLYTGVLQRLTTANVGTTRSGTYDNMTWTLGLESEDLTTWDLSFTGASLMGTQQSLVNTAAALQNTYALQNAVLANSFSYDCPVFGEHNVCVSAGGRNTAVSAANGLNNTSALLIAAYRVKPTLRIGAYADQNLSVNNAGSTVNLGNSTPLIGLFGVWNQRLDGTGTEVKVSAAYGQKNATVNRQIVGLSEAGTGSSNLNSQGAQITAKYGFTVAPEVLVSPYVGVRYTQNNMGGYTESTSATVTTPLTYSALNTNATTALAGVGASYRFIPKATAFASAGVETDINTSGGTYSATGITGLTSAHFNPNPVKTRPTATIGGFYNITKSQRFGITGIYRQEPFQAVSTTSVLATYTIGL
jgi:hypothetical protein